MDVKNEIEKVVKIFTDFGFSNVHTIRDGVDVCVIFDVPNGLAITLIQFAEFLSNLNDRYVVVETKSISGIPIDDKPDELLKGIVQVIIQPIPKNAELN